MIEMPRNVTSPIFTGSCTNPLLFTGQQRGSDNDHKPVGQAVETWVYT